MNKLLLIAASVSIAVGTQGCTNAKKEPVVQDVKQITKLEEAAKSIQLAMDNLVVAENAKDAKSKHYPPTSVPGLETKLNIKWNGTVGNLLKHLKPVIKGYTLVSYGKEPSIPVIVNIESKNISVYDVIRDAGIQAGNRAFLSVNVSDPNNRKIELRYPS